jgi:hypothetical protein
MLRRSLCTIGLPLTLVALSSAQAADTTLTLACQGSATTGQAKPEPISMGIIVDFTNRTVDGFGYPGFSDRFDFPVKITGMNDVTVAFHGSNQTGGSITGSIDRVTGDVEARAQALDAILRYALKCRPTPRMF